MLVTLTEKELTQAVTNFLSDSYTIESLKFTVGRNGSGTRAEVEVSIGTTDSSVKVSRKEKDEPSVSSETPRIFGTERGED